MGQIVISETPNNRGRL